MTVKTKDLLELFGITSMTLTNWERDGMPKLGRGKFDLAAVIKWRISKIEDRYKNKTDNLDLKQDEARIAKAKADMLELDLAERNGELVSAQEVADLWFNLTSNLKVKLLTLPSKFGLQLAGKTKAAEIQSIMREVIIELLNEMETSHKQKKLSDN